MILNNTFLVKFDIQDKDEFWVRVSTEQHTDEVSGTELRTREERQAASEDLRLVEEHMGLGGADPSFAMPKAPISTAIFAMLVRVNEMPTPGWPSAGR